VSAIILVLRTRGQYRCKQPIHGPCFLLYFPSTHCSSDASSRRRAPQIVRNRFGDGIDSFFKARVVLLQQ